MAAYRAVVVAASSGGVDALRRLLGTLSPDLPASLVIVLHTASEHAGGLCEVLRRASPLPVAEARPRERAQAGQIYLAPPGYHLLVEKDGRFALSVDEKVCYVRPSADVLFESAAEAWAGRLIAVVLTGANEDGAQGLAAVRARGGLAVVQQPEDAEFATMPEAALRIAGADHVLPIDEIGPLLNQLLAARLAAPDR
jgi:two-component system chemotaxis response regulator CheB